MGPGSLLELSEHIGIIPAPAPGQTQEQRGQRTTGAAWRELWAALMSVQCLRDSVERSGQTGLSRTVDRLGQVFELRERETHLVFVCELHPKTRSASEMPLIPQLTHSFYQP